jgi:hypothetical protein
MTNVVLTMLRNIVLKTVTVNNLSENINLYALKLNPTGKKDTSPAETAAGVLRDKANELINGINIVIANITRKQ